VPDEDLLWSREMRRPSLVVGLDVPAAVLENRIRLRTLRMLERGAAEEARSALSGTISRTAAKALGLDALATLPPEEAADRIAVRTRRYAAYQRKWMRRIPGLVTLDGTTSPEEVVDEVLDLARAR
jgi:tRNA A37 N6-isopentenylltransferase MiaA